ncbi:MAG: tetratricopeptide repeat protein [Prevotella sp.]|nr:tetratricopeptide repeat protein [Prevotella sp.]
MKGKSPIKHLFLIALAVIAASLTGCSTQKNTAQSRWWHAFNARYNTYYNGTVAYIDGALEKEEGNRDNFTEQIPLYTVGNKNSRELGKANFDRAIEKCEKAIHQHSIKRRPEWQPGKRKTAKDIEWLSRREYNPFLWKAWMLMGRSQFQKGDFEGAAATFAYMSRLYSTQPAIYGKARAWLAKCYIEQGWTYDAEDVIRNIQRDSIHWRAQKEWDYAFADYYIHTGDARKAIPYLRKVISHEMRHKQKARQWYLMGQLQASIGNRKEAYQAFRHVIRLNPPYELEFNARIAITEVLASGNSRKMISRLKRMAASDKNKEYQDQVYYAIGNIHLAQKDTLRAIYAYEKGNRKATRNGIEKGVLLLRLGNLYWETERYADAKRCYGEAIGLLDQDRKDYPQLAHRSKVLDELVPYTDAIALQDSLQSLAQMDERDRNAAIDRVIAALKRKEKEEERRRWDDEAERNSEYDGGVDGNDSRNDSRKGSGNGFGNASGNGFGNDSGNGFGNTSTWYFYSPTAVSQGKALFEKLWGKRKNLDNWQRINKTVVASAQENDIAQENDSEKGATSALDSKLQPDASRDSQSLSVSQKESGKPSADSASLDPHQRAYYLAQIPFTPEQTAASNQLLADGLYHAGIIFKDRLDNLALSEKMLLRLVDNYPDFAHLDDAYYHLYLLYSRKKQTLMANSYVEKLKKDYPESRFTTLLSDPYYLENARMGVHIEDSIYTLTYQAFKEGKYEVVMHNSEISDKRFPTGANRDKFLFISGMTQLNEGKVSECLEKMNQVIAQYPNSRLSEMAGMIVNGVNAGRRLYGGKFDLSNVWAKRSDVLSSQDSTQQKRFSADRNDRFVFLLAYSPDSVNENQLLFEVAKYNFTTYMARNFDISIEDLQGLHRLQVSGFQNYDEARQYANELHQQAGILRLISQARSYVISEPNLELLGRNLSYDDYDKFYTRHFAPLKISKMRLLMEPAEIVVDKEEQKEEDANEEENSQKNEDDSQKKNPEDNNIYIEPQPAEDTDTGIYFDDSNAQDPKLDDEYIELDGF